MNVCYYLSPPNYESIRHTMVATTPQYPSETSVISYDETPRPASGLRADASFARQQGQLVLAPETVNANLSGPPEGIVLTANSAIPLADAVRGFYAELDLQLPIMSRINAGQDVSHCYYQEVGDPNFVTYSLRGSKKFKHGEVTEISRLREVFAGFEHVSVIDQYVATGKTVTYAAQLLLAAGVKQVSAVRGKWYVKARPDTLIDGLSSTHRDFMHQVGIEAAQTADIYYKHFANKGHESALQGEPA